MGPSPPPRILKINIKLDAFRNFSLNFVFNHRVVFNYELSLTLRYVFCSSNDEKNIAEIRCSSLRAIL
jgi:hypothetical protein